MFYHSLERQDIDTLLRPASRGYTFSSKLVVLLTSTVTMASVRHQGELRIP